MKKKYFYPFRKGSLFGLFFALSFFTLVPTLRAQPALSRGEQLISINYDEAMRRAKSALSVEGYRVVNEGGGFIMGQKQIHTTVIMCNIAPGEKTWVNIVVASDHTDGTVPGAERVKLQGLMDQPGGGTGASAKWRLTLIIPQGQSYAGTYSIDLNLSDQNGNLTGSGIWENGSNCNFTGTVKNNEVVLYRIDASGFRSTFQGRGTGDGRMEGTGKNDPSSPGGNNSSFTWSAIRK